MQMYPNYPYGIASPNTGIPSFTPQMVPQNNISFAAVHGKDEAISYPIAPGNTVYLIDLDNPVIYKKVVDATGRISPMVTFVVEKEEPTANPSPEYVTKDEFASMVAAVLSDMRQKKHKKEAESDV